MIKSLFEPDEQKSEEIKTERKEKAASESAAEEIVEPQYIEVNEAENLFDSPAPTFENLNDSEKPLTADELESLNSFVETTSETTEFPQSQFDSPEETFAETTGETKDFSESPYDSSENPFTKTRSETENHVPPVEIVNKTGNSETAASESPAETAYQTLNYEPAAEIANETAAFELPGEPKIETAKPAYDNEMLFQPLAEPESFAETARKSGLAYAAAITLTASIVFMLVIGWFADLLFGSSPWGIVGGIILGSLIGFVQFFRMTAQIFKK